MASSGYHKTSGTIFALVALGHLWRAIQGLPATVGATPVPVWISWAAVVVAGALSLWAFRTSK